MRMLTGNALVFAPAPAVPDHPPRVQTLQNFRCLVEERGVAEISLGHFAAAARQQRGVDVQLKVQPEESLCGGFAARLEDTHQCLSRGEMRRLGLIPQPIATRLRVRSGKPDAAAHAFDRAEHFAGLPPRPIQQQDVGRQRVMGPICRGGQRISMRVKNPYFAPGRDRMGREAGS
jgi:hypothetical protein